MVAARSLPSLLRRGRGGGCSRSLYIQAELEFQRHIDYFANTASVFLRFTSPHFQPGQALGGCRLDRFFGNGETDLERAGQGDHSLEVLSREESITF